MHIERNITVGDNHPQNNNLNSMKRNKIHPKSNADSDHEYELKKKKKKKKDKERKKERRGKKKENSILKTSYKSVFSNSSSREVKHVPGDYKNDKN
jgi:hypothetical protein